MPNYSFSGVDLKGKNIRGTVVAENLNVAKSKLKLQGVIVTDLQDASQIKNAISLISKKKSRYQNTQLYDSQSICDVESRHPSRRCYGHSCEAVHPPHHARSFEFYQTISQRR